MTKKIKAFFLIAMIFFLMLLIKKMIANNISTVEEFQILMQSYGIFGPIILTAIQALQVVIPVLPGYLGCVVGAVSYGAGIGFLCNYIGISIGSIIAFFLAEKHGKQLIIDMFSERQFDKWTSKIKGKKSYDMFLFVATLLPLFPDDFLCYFSGLMRMERKRFVWIIILGKPWCILAYSVFFGLIGG